MFTSDDALFEFRGPWGVPVQIGPSMIFLVLVYVSFTSGPAILFYDLVFLALILLSIFLHELGHAWGALIQGIPVRRIMLHGGGGFCERGGPATPWQEELVVAMGPIVNLGLWAVAALLAPLAGDGDAGWVVAAFAWINLFLGIFNLIPVRPLDGGKLFQLALMRVLPMDHAIRITGAVGLAVALLWIPMMLASYLLLGMVLLFMPSIRDQWEMLRRPA